MNQDKYYRHGRAKLELTTMYYDKKIDDWSFSDIFNIKQSTFQYSNML